MYEYFLILFIVHFNKNDIGNNLVNIHSAKNDTRLMLLVQCNPVQTGTCYSER